MVKCIREGSIWSVSEEGVSPSGLEYAGWRVYRSWVDLVVSQNITGYTEILESPDTDTKNNSSTDSNGDMSVEPPSKSVNPIDNPIDYIWGTDDDEFTDEGELPELVIPDGWTPASVPPSVNMVTGMVNVNDGSRRLRHRWERARDAYDGEWWVGYDINPTTLEKILLAYPSWNKLVEAENIIAYREVTAND